MIRSTPPGHCHASIFSKISCTRGVMPLREPGTSKYASTFAPASSRRETARAPTAIIEAIFFSPLQLLTPVQGIGHQQIVELAAHAQFRAENDRP